MRPLSFVAIPLLLNGSWAAAVEPPRPVAPPVSAAVPVPVSVPAPVQVSDRSATPVLRFSISTGISLAGLEVDGKRKVDPVPDKSLYEGDALSGSFQSYGLTTVRTLESVALPIGEGRDVIIGGGVEALSSLGEAGKFKRSKASEFSMQIWSLCLESGLRRRLWEGQGVEILLGGAYSLGGKALFSYKGLGEDGSQSAEVFDDKISKAWRASLVGRYTFRFLTILEAGVALEGYYGQIEFSARDKSTAMQGSAVHALFAFAID